MRKSLLLAFLFFSALSGFSQFTQTYNGNGKTGFGGAIGGGTLAITDEADSIIFTLQKGAGVFDSVLVFYLQVTDTTGLTTPIASTSELPGSTDPYKAAVAGLNTNVGERAVLNFPSDFHPNGAIAINNTGGRIYLFTIFGVVERLAFDVSPSGTNSAPEYRVAANKATVGFNGRAAFRFVGTYIGPNGSRSDEAFGDPFTGYLRTARTASYNPYTITNFFVFANTLPVKLKDFKATKERDGVTLNWSVEQESGIEAYEVQRSGNGVQFNTIKTVTARNSPAPSSYSAKDYAPNATGSYYRLAIRENGKYAFSKVAYIGSDKGKGNLVASYQSGNSLLLGLNGIPAGTYRLSVLNNSGQAVHAASLQHNGGNTNEQLNLQSSLSKGIYRVVLQSAKEKYAAAILVQ